MARPRAAQTIKRHWTGDDNGVGTVLESCLMQLTFEDGTTIHGEICLVRMAVGHQGLPYAVTCDGQIICHDGFLAAFATIADAADFAKL